MTRLLIFIDGEDAREVVLARQETTIGRKPHNDIVIDHLAVSSQHAVLRSDQGELWIEDLKSTNGTYVNGLAVSRRRLAHRDVIELGKVRLEVRLHDVVDDIESPPCGPNTDEGLVRAVQEPAVGVDPDVSGADLRGGVAQIRVLNGAAAGREVLLTRERTTIGKPGVLVVAIERVGGSHLISQVEGMRSPNVNGRAIGSLGMALVDGDVIELAGTQIAFIAP